MKKTKYVCVVPLLASHGVWWPPQRKSLPDRLSGNNAPGFSWSDIGGFAGGPEDPCWWLRPVRNKVNH